MVSARIVALAAFLFSGHSAVHVQPSFPRRPPTAEDFLNALNEDASRIDEGGIFHNAAYHDRRQRAQQSFVANVVLEDRFLQDDGMQEHEATKAARDK